MRAEINFPQRLNKIIINKVKSPTTNIKYDGTSNRINACKDPLLVPSDMRRSPTCERCHSEGRRCVLSPIWLPCWILCVVRVRGYLIGRCSRDPEPMKISDLIRTQGWEADGFSNVPLSPTTTTVATSLSEHSASVCTLGASHLLAGEVCRGWDWLMV